MKATEQHFHVVPFIVLYRWFKLLSLWKKPEGVTIQIKAILQYFHELWYYFYAAQSGSNFQAW